MIVNFMVPRVTKDGEPLTSHQVAGKIFLIRLNRHVIDPIVKEWGGCTHSLVTRARCETSESEIITDNMVVVRVGITTKYGSDEIGNLVVKNWFCALAHKVGKAFNQDTVYFEILNDNTLIAVSEFSTTDSSIKPKPKTKTITDVVKGASH